MIGKQFLSLEDGIQFYKEYARSIGFDVRKSSAKKSGDTITWRYILCSREGEKHSAAEDENDDEEGNIKTRRRVSMRCGCPARVVLKFNGLLGYVVHRFDEQHNHP